MLVVEEREKAGSALAGAAAGATSPAVPQEREQGPATAPGRRDPVRRGLARPARLRNRSTARFRRLRL